MGSTAPEVTQTTTIHVDCPFEDPNAQPDSLRPAIHWFADPPKESSSAAADQETEGTSPTYHIVTQITAEPPARKSMFRRIRKAYKRCCKGFTNMDPVKLAYLRTSFVFAISVLITWTPSSINRVHDLVTRSSASFGLNLASGIVLPLQGFWNAVIFFSTSWNPLKSEISVLIGRMKGMPRGHQDATATRYERERELELDNRCHRKGRDDASSEVTGSTMRVMRDASLTSL